MTLVVIGPVTDDLIIVGREKSNKIGGATYYQSFVFEKFYTDYIAVVNTSNENVANEFPSQDKVKVILKSDKHYFINEYPYPDNLDIREQLSNFANIPILKSDLKEVLPDKIDAFVINPLNRYDFPAETMDYLKSFNVPIFVSVQGFLRVQNLQVNENYTIKLSNFDKLSDILSGVDAIFLDEVENNIIKDCCDISEKVITNGSNGSRIISDEEIKIKAVECEDIIDTTGCGDTFMAAYISQRLKNKSIKYSADFASKIASEKLKKFGHY